LVIDAALGRRPELDVYGDDYATPDGTCLRDYVHVTDLAQAHLLALDRLDSSSVTVNLGNGQGHSVLQVIETVQRVSGRKVPYRICPRRPGDPTILVASSERARRELGWTPRFADLDEIVRTALRWREAHPNGYAD
jgi:UDP-glucose 4-epimerase